LENSTILNKGAKINLMEKLDGVIMQSRFSRVSISYMLTSRPKIAA
jgi:hypothetical protein